MRLFARREVGEAGARASRRCFTCGYFRNDRAAIAAALPGLLAFASTEASVFADDGLCGLRDTLVDGWRGCEAHRTRG